MKANLISALVASAFLATAAGVLAHDDGAEKLGTVHFSTSCNPTVQPQFERAVAHANAMEQLARRYPEDSEASVFYALVLDVTALPTDKTFANQLKAAAILEKVSAAQPDHPGSAHYMIHSYDYPSIAAQGLPAARRYASVAPSAAHALHMPGHIFTRRGLWDESIETNLRSVARSKNHFDSLNALDYLEYAYLQQGRDSDAKPVR